MTVVHHKTQQATGEKLATSFMEDSLLMCLTPDVAKAGRLLETFWKRVAVKNKVQVSDLHHVVYVDMTKFGTPSQMGVNKTIELISTVLRQNPKQAVAVVLAPLLTPTSSSLRAEHRRFEDKAQSCSLEVRDIVINMDLSGLHGNRVMPQVFKGWLLVEDSVLPMKGVDHRAPKQHPAHEATERAQPVKTESSEINVFTRSALWQKMTCDTLPKAISEDDFEVPEATSLRSGETRRSYTDKEETAQWLGGVDVPRCLLDQVTAGLGGSAKRIFVVHHISLYDACVEKAVMQLMDQADQKWAAISLTDCLFVHAAIERIQTPQAS